MARGLVFGIDADAVVHNIFAARTALGPGVAFWAVVKADAYGFGLDRIVAAAAPHVDGFAAGDISDARRIIATTPGTKVLVYASELDGPVPAGAIATAWDSVSLRRLLAEPESAIAIKVDVGLGRLGFAPGDARTALRELTSTGRSCAAVYTHLSDPATDARRTHHEVGLFGACVDELRRDGFDGFAMFAASAMVLNVPGACGEAVNCGHLLYGFALGPERRDSAGLRDVAVSLSAGVIQVRTLRRGERIGYGNAARELKRDTVAAVVSAGYSDGYPVPGQTEGAAIVGGRRCPLLYPPTLEHTVLDVTSVSCEPGHRALFIGRDGPTTVRFHEAAAWAQLSELALATRIRAARTYDP